MVARTLSWKLLRKYVISDQTNVNCVLIITCQETVLVPAITEFQEKRLQENFTPAGMRSINLLLFSLFVILYVSLQPTNP